MWRLTKMALCGLSLATLLTSCGHSPEPPVPLVVERVVIRRPDIDAHLLTCDLPAPGGIAMDSDWAWYAYALFGAASRCRENVAAIERIVRAPE